MSLNAKNEISQKTRFNTQFLFLKESHLTSPQSPTVFKQPPSYGIKFEIAVSFSALDENLHEVCLKLTVTAYPKKAPQDSEASASTDTDDLASIDTDATPVYSASVQQAGLFLIEGFDETQRDQIKKVTCAELLFPFARAQVVTLVAQAGFAPVYLAPINFAAVNAQAQKMEENQLKDGPV